MRARLLGIALLLACLAASCGSDAPPSPTPVEWYDLSQATDLGRLQSYRARYAFRWQSSDVSQPGPVSWDVMIESVREPAARHVLWLVEDTNAESVIQEEYIQLGDNVWVRDGVEWLPASADQADVFAGNPLLRDPLILLAGTRAMRVQSHVTINTVAASRYSFDHTTHAAPPAGSLTKANGNVWISGDHAVIVKYEARYEGQSLVPGPQGPGVLDVAFDLTDINRRIDIRSPLESPPALASDIPVPADATGLVAFAGITEFRSATTQEELAAFFGRELPRQGWHKVESIGTSLLTYSKDARTVQILIEPLEDQTVVTIVIMD